MRIWFSIIILFLAYSTTTEAQEEGNETFFGMPFDEELCEAKECEISKNWTSQEKCAYIKCNSDSCEGGGYLSWSQYVTCQYSKGAKIVIIIAGVIYLLILFLIMSVVADDFFSPAISGIVSHLKMSESIAGVTFLAFGNGAPDVFGSISSVLTTTNPKADLALGDLFGGSIFVTTIVLSAIIFTKSFKIAIIPTIRDILFFMVALAFILFCFLKFDHVEVWMPATYLGIYAVYVLSVIVLHILRKRRKLRKAKKELELSRPSSSSSVVPIVDAVDMKKKNLPISTVVQFIVGYTRFMRKLRRFRMAAERKMKIEDEKKRVKKILGFDNIAFTGDNIFNNEVEYGEFQYIKDENEEIDYDDEGEEAEFVFSHGTVFTSHDQANTAIPNVETIKIRSWNSWNWVRDVWNHLKPYPTADEFREMNIFSKIMSILKTIPVFCFKLTMPSNELSWCKPLFILQCFTTIQFALFAIQILNKKPFHGSPGLWLYGLGVSAVLATVAMIFTPLTREQKYYKEAFSYISFLMSIAWIYITSNEIVGVLTMIGVISGLSQELLGLTIMAWSNCIGDIVADTAVVRQGFPKMAMAAAIGGPLFNLLIGFGLPFTIAAGQGKKITLQINPVYRLLMLFLGISLVTTLVAIFIQKFQVRWPHAVVLIIIFVIYIIFICLSEFHVLEWK